MMLNEIAARFKELIDAGAKHDPAMHEGTNHCEGCERSDLVKMMKLLLDSEDDTKVQNTPELRGLSRKAHAEGIVGQRWTAHKAAHEARKKK